MKSDLELSRINNDKKEELLQQLQAELIAERKSKAEAERHCEASLEEKDHKILKMIDDSSAKVDAFEMTLASMKSDLELSRINNDKKEELLQQLQAELIAERKSKAEAERHCETSREELVVLCQRSKTVEDALLKNSRTRSLLQSQVNNALDTIDEISNRESRLQAKLDSGKFVIDSLGQKIVHLKQELTHEQQSRLLVHNMFEKQRHLVVELEGKHEAAQRCINSLRDIVTRLEGTIKNALTDKIGLEKELHDEKNRRMIVIQQLDDQRRQMIDLERGIPTCNVQNKMGKFDVVKKQGVTCNLEKVQLSEASPQTPTQSFKNAIPQKSPEGYQPTPLKSRQLWTSFVSNFFAVFHGEPALPDVCLDDYGRNKVNKLFQELSFERIGSPMNEQRHVHIHDIELSKSAQSSLFSSDDECYFDALSEEEDLLCDPSTELEYMID